MTLHTLIFHYLSIELIQSDRIFPHLPHQYTIDVCVQHFFRQKGLYIDLIKRANMKVGNMHIVVQLAKYKHFKF